MLSLPNYALAFQNKYICHLPRAIVFSCVTLRLFACQHKAVRECLPGVVAHRACGSLVRIGEHGAPEKTQHLITFLTGLEAASLVFAPSRLAIDIGKLVANRLSRIEQEQAWCLTEAMLMVLHSSSSRGCGPDSRSGLSEHAAARQSS